MRCSVISKAKRKGVVNARSLRHGLKTKQFGSKIYAFETIDSTNQCARALAGCWAREGTVIIAEQQTAGRGRMGRSWQANPYENLTFSIILRPSAPPEEMSVLPLCIGVALAEAIERVTGLDVQCKWPNDLLIHGRKTCGILLEGSLREATVEFVVVGIGLNVNQQIFPDELAGKATSLALEAGRPIDREELFREIMRSLESHYLAITRQGYGRVIPLWNARAAMIGRQIAVSQNGTVLQGIVKGVSESGALLLEREGETMPLLAGDVTILDQGATVH